MMYFIRNCKDTEMLKINVTNSLFQIFFLNFSYVPPPYINKTSGEHVTVGQNMVLTCTITVEWSVQVRGLPSVHRT